MEQAITSNYRCPERPKSTVQIIIGAVAPAPTPTPVSTPIPTPIPTSTCEIIGGFYDVKSEPPSSEPSPDRSKSTTRTSPIITWIYAVAPIPIPTCTPTLPLLALAATKTSNCMEFEDHCGVQTQARQ